MVMRDPKGGFHVANVKFEKSSKALVGQAGLQSLLKILDTSELGLELAACLPEEGSNRATGNYKLGVLLIAGLLSGHDCIDDIEEFEDDELLISIFEGPLPTAKTMGNFLRRFEPEHIARLKLFLTKMGYTLRTHTQKVHSHKGESYPHFKMDGTTHEQHGRQMEGCGWIKTSDEKSVYGYASQLKPIGPEPKSKTKSKNSKSISTLNICRV
jgi:hypothetical protein